MITAKQIVVKSAADEITPAFGLVDLLASGELVTGTPTAVEITTSDLTISNVAVNTATVSINGVDHIAGQAITMKITGGTAKVEYGITITGVTDATIPQTFVRKVRLKVL